MNKATKELKLSDLDKVSGGFDASIASTGPYVPTITWADLVKTVTVKSK